MVYLFQIYNSGTFVSPISLYTSRGIHGYNITVLNNNSSRQIEQDIYYLSNSLIRSNVFLSSLLFIILSSLESVKIANFFIF
jgi:hypothetical protein